MTNTNSDSEIVLEIPNVKMPRRELLKALIFGEATIVLHIDTNPDTTKENTVEAIVLPAKEYGKADLLDEDDYITKEREDE